MSAVGAMSAALAPAPSAPSDPLYLIAQIAMSSLVVYCGQKSIATNARSELFSGGQVRRWFLSILIFGMGARILCNVFILLIPRQKPFVLAWLHFVPALILLSSYSLLVVYFTDLRKDSKGAIIPGCADPQAVRPDVNEGGSRATLSYIAPILIPCNILLYVMFAVVGSLAHMRHAHLEFRIAGSIFIGVTHLAIALAWAYNAGMLSLRVVARARKSSNLIRLDEPLLGQRDSPVECSPARNTQFSGWSSARDDSSSSTVAGINDNYYLPSFFHMSRALHSVKRRICVIAVLCPLSFGIGGTLEVYKGYSWIRNRDASKFFTQFSAINLLIYAVEVLPAFICVASFSYKPPQNFSIEEKFVRASIEDV